MPARVTLFAHTVEKCNLIHPHMGIHILRLFKKIRIFWSKNGYLQGPPKGVLEKMKRGLKTTFPLTFGKKKRPLSFLNLFISFQYTPLIFDFFHFSPLKHIL
jgi:hypothetical protein